MEKVDFATVIQEAISSCSRKRIGSKPLVFVTLAPVMTRVPWHNHSAEEFIQRFLYEALMTSDAEALVEVSLRRRNSLTDLSAFVGIKPRYWIQLRVQGRGLRLAEYLVNDIFSEVGLRAEEWLGVDGSNSRLAIFGTIDAPKLKMVFCLESLRHRQKCDLLLPIADADPASEFVAESMAS